MAILLANKDGTSNAKPGDVVVTGGGIFRKNEDGTSTKVQALPTYGGKTSDYNIVTNIWREMTGTGGDYMPTNAAPKTQSPIDQVLNDTQVFDSVTNYDSFTTPGSGSSALYTGQKINFSNIMGYIIVGLVLLVVLDKLIGGGK
jgi:hypothetical protein